MSSMTKAVNPVEEEDIRATFLAAEYEGIRLAIKGRFVAIASVALLYLLTRSGYFVEIILVAAVLLLLGFLHFRLVGSRFDRPWVKFIFITIDILLLSVAIASTPEVAAHDLPPGVIFRFDLFPFYFIALAVAAFSFSPWLVVWTGMAGAAAWLATFSWVTSQMPVTLNWADIPRNQGPEAYLEVFLSPYFAPLGTRLQEGLMLVTVAILLAIVMRRARRTVYLHLKADSERKTIADVFGRYVPRTIVDAVVSDRGSLAPVHREATVLFVDLAGFTRLTERLGAERIVEVLNEYFDTVTEIISERNGVVTQFQGDAVLATFNVPVEDAKHADRAVAAASDIIARIESGRFGNEALDVRIGVNTGSLIAGNVGGGGRQTYTVHGDAVNLAARLEAMNKELATRVLISASTAALLERTDLKRVAELEVRGLSGKHPVFTLTQRD